MAVLARKHEEFAKLGVAAKARLCGSDLIEYELNERGGPLSGAYVASLIEEARSQLVANDSLGSQFTFGTRPVRYLSSIIDAQSFPAIRGPVEAKLSELWGQVARSGAPGSVLDDYIWLAISMVVVYREAGLPLPDDYKVLARALKNKQPPIDPALFPYERKAWAVRVATYRLLVGTGNKRAFLDCVSDVWGTGVSMREAVAECLESYLRANRGVAFRDVAAIVGVVNALSRDRDVQVRRKAVGCAMRLLDTSADAEARSVLLRLARDPQYRVRSRLLKYDFESMGRSDMPRELARYLENDAHFGVRTMARRVLAQIRDAKTS